MPIKPRKLSLSFPTAQILPRYIFPFSGSTTVPPTQSSPSGCAPRPHLRNTAKEFAVDQVGLRLAIGFAIAFDNLPVSNGVLKFRRQLLRADGGNGNQREESEGPEAFMSFRFQDVIPLSTIVERTREIGGDPIPDLKNEVR